MMDNMNNQTSLIEQLKKLIPLANKAGLYDAADHLSSIVFAQKQKELLSDNETMLIRKLGGY